MLDDEDDPTRNEPLLTAAEREQLTLVEYHRRRLPTAIHFIHRSSVVLILTSVGLFVVGQLAPHLSYTGRIWTSVATMIEGSVSSMIAWNTRPASKYAMGPDIEAIVELDDDALIAEHDRLASRNSEAPDLTEKLPLRLDIVHLELKRRILAPRVTNKTRQVCHRRTEVHESINPQMRTLDVGGFLAVIIAPLISYFLTLAGRHGYMNVSLSLIGSIIPIMGSGLCSMLALREGPPCEWPPVLLYNFPEGDAPQGRWEDVNGRRLFTPSRGRDGFEEVQDRHPGTSCSNSITQGCNPA